jgi:hypothetical protein
LSSNVPPSTAALGPRCPTTFASATAVGALRRRRKDSRFPRCRERRPLVTRQRRERGARRNDATTSQPPRLRIRSGSATDSESTRSGSR